MNGLSVGLKGKLIMLICGALVCFGGAIGYALYGISKVSNQIETVTGMTVPFASVAANVRSRTHATMRFIWRSSLVENNSDERRTTLLKIQEFRKMLMTNVDELQKFKEISAEAKPIIVEINDLRNQMNPLVDTAIKHLEARTPADTHEVVLGAGKELAPLSVRMTEAGLKLSEIADHYAEADGHEAMARAKALQLNLLLIAVGTGIMFLAIAFVFATRIAKQLGAITSSVSNASLQVSSASQQLSNSSENLSSSSQEQASALEQTSASLTEISTMSDANASGAEQVDRSVKEVYQITDDTRKSMTELASAMKLILESNGRIEKLVKVIEEIGEKTEVIDEIVFKTQLLSFNASVEAERAGEHGRGFAVVAQEVGNLALVSGRAAQDISSIVKVSIKEAESVASENKMRVESGGILAQSTKDKMETVLSNLTGIINSVDKIVSACREQKQGINQISTSIQSLSQATQETAGTAEEAASASVELSGQGTSLLSLVRELRGIVHGLESDAKAGIGERIAIEVPDSASNVLSMKPSAAPLKARYETRRTPMRSTGTDSTSFSSETSANGSAWEKL